MRVGGQGAPGDTDGGAGGGYMAAVRAAAAAAQRERMDGGGAGAKGGVGGTGGAADPSTASPTRAPAGPRAGSERERTRERLHALYEGGLVVTVPFLQAAHAQPLAMLQPLNDAVWCDMAAQASPPPEGQGGGGRRVLGPYCVRGWSDAPAPQPCLPS